MTVTGRKVFALVTGASRGIGREIAVQLSQKIADGSALLITARNSEQLQLLKQQILQNKPNLDIYVVVNDAANLDETKMAEFEAAISSALSKAVEFDCLLMIHNAGTIGDLSKKAYELNVAKEWHDFLQINLIAMIIINNFVLAKFSKDIVSERIIVNISSLSAFKPFPSFSEYSVAKAAREAFFRSLVVEDPSLRILTYSPGPVLTDMYEEVALNSYDESMRSIFKSRDDKMERKALKPEETVAKMFEILEKNTFENAIRVDYFDQ